LEWTQGAFWEEIFELSDRIVQTTTHPNRILNHNPKIVETNPQFEDLQTKREFKKSFNEYFLKLFAGNFLRFGWKAKNKM
jgi:hypothetical protein